MNGLPTNPLFYLGQPYWADDAALRAQRADYGSAAAAHLLSHGILCFSPIACGIAVKRFLKEERVCDHAFWMNIDLPLLARCDALAILPIDGWKESGGLGEELGSARGLGLPVFFLAGFIPGVGRLWPPPGTPTIDCTQQGAFIHDLHT
jgi:hypothetical protein